MTSIRLCLQNQTPLVRLVRPAPHGAHLKDLEEGVDSFPSPGGVTRMLSSLISEMAQRLWNRHEEITSAQCGQKKGTRDVWRILDGALHEPNARWHA